MTELRTLQGVLTHLAEDRPEIHGQPAAGAADASSRATDWSTDGRVFASLDESGNGVELRLDDAVAKAATRTPDTTPSPRGEGWVRFAPAMLDDHAVDRARGLVRVRGPPRRRPVLTARHTEAVRAMPDYGEFDRYVDEHMPAWTEELAAICRFPSEAVNRQALRDNAAWVAERLERLGAAVDVVTIAGEDVAPLVLGEIGPAPDERPTLIAVQHYDVQPAVPLDLWTTPPYQPQVRDGRLYARGAADDKGELMARVWAVEAYRATIGELPCRVRFLVEGEEEGGGANLGRLLDLRPEARRADGALIEGGDIDVRGRPRVFGGVRGMAVLELTCRTIAYDAHSSLSNLLPSAAIRLIEALATFWDADGAPAIAGLDRGVRPPSAAQLAALAEIPDEDVDDLLAVYGIDRFVGGLRGQAAIRRLRLSPTCNVQGLWSGYIGPGGKTITPSEAHARVDIRLVPDQDPNEIADVVRRHLAERGFGDIQIRMFDFSYRAWWTEPDHPIVRAAVRASEAVLGTKAILDLSSPGTAPMHEICAAHDVPATSLGGSDDDVRVHAPDESFSLAYAAAATKMTGRFLTEFAAACGPRRGS